MKNNDKSNLNDKELENISGGNMETKKLTKKIYPTHDTPIPPVVTDYGGPDPRFWDERLKRKLQEEKELDIDPMLPSVSSEED